jgi:pyruvate dehydrogenase E1 component alpha subunit
MPATRATVLKLGAATDAQLETYAKQIEAEIDDALQFALDSPFPDVREIDVDIYAAVAPL